jgi:hypothetical protein
VVSLVRAATLRVASARRPMVGSYE